MIILVGGLIGAGKSSVARRLADRLGYLYFDLDETKKEVYGRDPDNMRKLAQGIAPDLETRAELYREAFARITGLLETHPNIVFDDTLHFRRFRLFLYDEMERIGQDFIMVWVRADEDVIVNRLSSVERENHILSDPIPLHEQMVRDFEDFQVPVVMCPNNGAIDDSVDGLFVLLDRIRSMPGPES
jgi:predicted kinase